MNRAELVTELEGNLGLQFPYPVAVRIGCVSMPTDRVVRDDQREEIAIVALLPRDIEIDKQSFRRPDHFTVSDGRIWAKWQGVQGMADSAGFIGDATPANIVHMAQLGIPFREGS